MCILCLRSDGSRMPVPLHRYSAECTRPWSSSVCLGRSSDPNTYRFDTNGDSALRFPPRRRSVRCRRAGSTLCTDSPRRDTGLYDSRLVQNSGCSTLGGICEAIRHKANRFLCSNHRHESCLRYTIHHCGLCPAPYCRVRIAWGWSLLYRGVSRNRRQSRKRLRHFQEWQYLLKIETKVVRKTGV